MNSSDTRGATRLGLWVLVVVSIFAWAPAMFPGYWQALEGFVPVFNAANPAPIADIATLPDLWRGTGSAAFLLAQPFILFGLGTVFAVRITFILCFIIGGLATYIWLQPRFGDRAAALAGIIYVFLPPFLATVYIRGNLGDAVFLAALPVALAGYSAYAQSHSPGAAGVAVIATLWMWRTQAGLALLVTLPLLAYTLWVERDRLAVLVAGVASIAGVLSLVPLWDIRSPSPVEFSQHFVAFFQFLGNGWQVAPSVPGWQDGFPFQLGFPAVAFTLIAAWLAGMGKWRKQPSPEVDLTGRGRLLGFAFGAIVVGVFLSLGVSAPLWRLSRADQLLTYPWQVLLAAAPFLAAGAGSLPALNKRLACTGYWTALLVLVLMSSYPYLTTDFTEYQPPDVPVALVGPANDLVLLEANLVKESAPDRVELTVVWQPLQPMRFDYNVFFQALQFDEAQDQLQVVAQLDAQPLADLPATAWQVGQILSATYQLDLPVDPNQTQLQYYFGYYDWRDGSRLPVNNGADDKVVFYGP
jgi:hypothetical protein